LENHRDIRDVISLNPIRNSIISSLKDFISNRNTNNPTERKIQHLLKSTEKFIEEHPDILFTRADKGNITVALNKNFYIEKMEMLCDTNTYTKIKKNPIKNIEKN